MAKVGYFPASYPGELTYSILARFLDQMQYPSQKLAGKQLLGTFGATASVTLPSRLGRLISVLPPGHSYTVERLIDNHTLLPFYSPFLPSKRVESLRQDMRGDNGLSVYMRSGSTSSCIHSPDFLRFCPLCSQEDKKHYGECYWHREHQIPGVEVCPIHNVFLENTHARAQSRRIRYEFIVAAQAIQNVIPQALDLSNPWHQNLVKISQDANWLLNQPNFTPGLESIRARYLCVLVDRGLACYSGQVHIRQLLEAFKNYYPPNFLNWLQCEIREEDNNNWLFRLLRSPKQSRHPLYHLLFINFLGYSVGEFFQLSGELKPFGDRPWPCLNPICEYFRQPIIQEYQLKYDKSHGGRLTGTFCCNCGFTYSRMGPDKSPEDRFKVGKIKTFGHKWEATLQEVWQDSTFTLQAMAARLGVDLQTVKHQAVLLNLSFPRLGPTARQIQINTVSLPAALYLQPSEPSKQQAYRAEWLSALSENPDASRSFLAHKYRRIHSWLYLYDRVWLTAHLPPPKKRGKQLPQVNWEKRDAQIADLVRACAQRLKKASGSPVQVTKTAIASDIGYLALIQKQLDKLPLTAFALACSVESTEEFAQRRVQWAVDCFRQENVYPQRWQIIRRTGMKSSTAALPQVKEALAVALQSLARLDIM